MRRIIVNNIISLDGFYSDASGSPLGLSMDAAFDQANLETIEAADIVLLGRDSFDGFSAYWPHVADAPPPEDPSAPEARAVNEVNRAISRRYNELPKVVVSDRGGVGDDNPWASSSEVVGRADIADWWTDTANDGEGDVAVFGSHIMWNGLLAIGLVDELHLMISPVLLGTGVPAFREPAQLELIEARRFDDSDNVQLRYRNPARQ